MSEGLGKKTTGTDNKKLCVEVQTGTAWAAKLTVGFSSSQMLSPVVEFELCSLLYAPAMGGSFGRFKGEPAHRAGQT
jgi:hypothetical protein